MNLSQNVMNGLSSAKGPRSCFKSTVVQLDLLEHYRRSAWAATKVCKIFITHIKDGIQIISVPTKLNEG